MMTRMFEHVPWLCGAFAIAFFGLSCCCIIATPAHGTEDSQLCSCQSWPACHKNGGCDVEADESCGSGTQAPCKC